MRWPSVAPAPQDAWLAGALTALSSAEVWRYDAGGGSLVAALTLGIAPICLAWRSRAPILSTCLVYAGIAACAQWSGEPLALGTSAAAIIGFATIGAMADRGRSVAALVVAMVLALFMTDPLTPNMYLAVSFTSFAVPWLLGLLWLHRKQAAETDRGQRLAAEAAVAEERLRLARELHDVVSHNVGMIAVQAGAADVLMDKDPARSRESLRAIEGGAKETLLELRRLLGLLRDDDPEPRNDGPSLRGLPQIAAPAAEAGIQVELRTHGDPVALDKTVELTAYRIVQEALTNAVAHAGPCRVTVSIAYEPEALDVEVTDDGTGGSGTSRGGYGLVGIRERVAAVGGSFEAGPRKEGGFRVHALLPLAGR